MPSSVRTIDRLYVLAIALVVVIGALLGAYFIAKVISNGETSCINDTLGDRNGVTAADQRAHITYAEQIRDATHHGKISATDQSRITNAYVRTLKHDQKIRDEHPLGHC